MYTAHWISPSPTLPYAGNSIAIGVVEDTITLIGTQTNVVMEFDTNSENFTVPQTNVLPATSSLYYGLQSVQIGCTLYFARNGGLLYTYDLANKQLIDNSIPSGSYGGHFCSDGSNYLYSPGGYYSKLFKFLDISGNQWNDGPSMSGTRYASPCVVVNGYLYTIGGTGSNNYVEKISITNILSNSWSYLSDTFSIGITVSSAIVYEERYIYVVGGWSGDNNLVYIIDTNTDTITLTPERLVYPTDSSRLAIVNNVLYSFGSLNGQQTWQKLQLLSLCN